jgi:glycosyltransferase involved in cell wall biosynthesis
MKVAMLVPSLRRRAPVAVAVDLADGLVARGHQVTVFHLDAEKDLVTKAEARRVKPWQIHAFQGFDVLHSHMLRPDCMAAAARLAGRGSPRALVTTIHNYVRADLANTHGNAVAAVMSRIWMKVWRSFDGAAVLSDDARRHYHSALGGDRLITIPNGRSPHDTRSADVEEHQALTALRATKTVLGANALVSPRKGLDQVLHALVHLPECVFVLVGDGEALPELKRLAAQLGVADRFHALGFKDNARDYLRYYDIYTMPSRSEGLPLALLEAAASGLSIVCSRLPVFAEVFNDSQASFFELDDTTALVAAVQRARNDRAVLGSAAQSRFEAMYSLDAMVERYLSLYGNLLEGRRVTAE